MSWYTDPQLFIYSFTYVYRITKEFDINTPIVTIDLTEGEILSFSKHLSLGDNKESDYDDFKAAFPLSGVFKFINCRGMVINWDLDKSTGTWSREEPGSPFWSLPGIGSPEEMLQAEIRALKKENSELKAENSILKAQVSREREEKGALISKREEMIAGLVALEQQVTDLTSKLVQ